MRALLAVVALLVVAPAASAAGNPWIEKTPLDIAHQGGEDEFPSNTMYAFQRSLQVGADMLELVLDEPTNDLDVDTLRALEEALLAFPGCAVIVSHDRWFLDRVCTHVLAFEGDSQVEWFEGNFEAWERRRRERLGDDAERPHRITYKKLTRA